MKPSGTPRRRKPLDRGKPPARTERMTSRDQWYPSAPRVLPPRRRSPRPKPLGEEERLRRIQVREAVLRRDRACVLNPGTANPVHLNAARGIGLPEHRCFGERETMHHLRKAGQGGAYTFDNLVLMCASGNDWVEDHPNDAHRIGLVKRRGDA